MPYPAGATTVAKGDVDAHSRAIASAFATVPGRVDGRGELDLHEVEGNFREGHRGAILRRDARPLDAFSYQRGEEDPRARA